jgi:hypothetical protein
MCVQQASRAWQVVAQQALTDDLPLAELQAVLEAGRNIPVRMTEKEALEVRVWSLDWEERANASLKTETPIGQLMSLFAELHAYEAQ